MGPNIPEFDTLNINKLKADQHGFFHDALKTIALSPIVLANATVHAVGSMLGIEGDESLYDATDRGFIPEFMKSTWDQSSVIHHWKHEHGFKLDTREVGRLRDGLHKGDLVALRDVNGHLEPVLESIGNLGSDFESPVDPNFDMHGLPKRRKMKTAAHEDYMRRKLGPLYKAYRGFNYGSEDVASFHPPTPVKPVHSAITGKSQSEVFKKLTSNLHQQQLELKRLYPEESNEYPSEYSLYNYGVQTGLSDYDKGRGITKWVDETDRRLKPAYVINRQNVQRDIMMGPKQNRMANDLMNVDFKSNQGYLPFQLYDNTTSYDDIDNRLLAQMMASRMSSPNAFKEAEAKVDAWWRDKSTNAPGTDGEKYWRLVKQAHILLNTIHAMGDKVSFAIMKDIENASRDGRVSSHFNDSNMPFKLKGSWSDFVVDGLPTSAKDLINAVKTHDEHGLTSLYQNYAYIRWINRLKNDSHHNMSVPITQLDLTDADEAYTGVLIPDVSDLNLSTAEQLQKYGAMDDVNARELYQYMTRNQGQIFPLKSKINNQAILARDRDFALVHGATTTITGRVQKQLLPKGGKRG